MAKNAVKFTSAETETYTIFFFPAFVHQFLEKLQSWLEMYAYG